MGAIALGKSIHFVLSFEKRLIRPGMVGTGFQEIMFNRTVCTGDKSAIDDGLEGFPSSHSTAITADFLFLSLYLNENLKIPDCILSSKENG